MNKNIKKTALISIVVIFCAIAAKLMLYGLPYVTKSHTGHFTLTNQSDEMIAHGTVSICGKTFAFENVEKDDSIEETYEAKGDSHYSITVVFASGATIKDEIGYVTTGFNYEDIITVAKTSITINRSNLQ
ncbi:MAG TPA: hypothetical protein PLK80_17890 [bacterium]|nr:MAG: hypothetical protein BWY28_00202 [bacterium ADurb.Bin236]HOY64061.1 hypothetical protein [bacterium]HPI78607.1 hypothetical protein [bacterium]HPN93496.1 hypothetical protein [bacterium]